jgi:hypothetical protein
MERTLGGLCFTVRVIESTLRESRSRYRLIVTDMPSPEGDTIAVHIDGF